MDYKAELVIFIDAAGKPHWKHNGDQAGYLMLLGALDLAKLDVLAECALKSGITEKISKDASIEPKKVTRDEAMDAYLEARATLDKRMKVISGSDPRCKFELDLAILRAI